LAAAFLAGAFLAAAFLAGAAAEDGSPREALAFSTDLASAARRSTTSPDSSASSGAWVTSPPETLASTSC
jgi:hypothetical protein